MIVNAQHGSTSSLQRRFKIGYARAGRIMDMLEEKGIVGPQNGSKPREVLLSATELEQLKALENDTGVSKINDEATKPTAVIDDTPKNFDSKDLVEEDIE